MKNTQKGFIIPLLIAIIVVLAICGGVYIYTKIGAKSNIVKDSDIVGWWTPSLAGDEKMAFYVDTKGAHQYNSYSNNINMYNGTWTLVNNRLTVTYDNPGEKPKIFTVVARYSNSIKLKDSNGEESTYTYEGNYPVYPDFSFNVTQRDIGDKYPEYTVEISKDGKVVKEVVVSGSEGKPDQFAISPNNKYIAFQTADIGGTCVFVGKPVVLNLENFSFVQFDTSNINKTLQSKGIIDATQHVIGLQWLSDDTLQAIMKFGEKYNGGSDCIRPAGKDSFIEVINFKVGV